MQGRNINVLKGILYCLCYLWYINYGRDIAILKLKWKKRQWTSICFISSISVWCAGTAGVCRLWWWARCTRSAWWTRASRSSLPSRSESITNTFCYVHVHISSVSYLRAFSELILLLHLQGIGAQMASGFDGKSGPQGMLSGSRVRSQQPSRLTSYTSQKVPPLTWLSFSRREQASLDRSYHGDCGDDGRTGM